MNLTDLRPQTWASTDGWLPVTKDKPLSVWREAKIALLSQPNCLTPISYNNVKIWLNLWAKHFFLFHSLTQSQCSKSLQSSKTDNVIGCSWSNYRGDARKSRRAADKRRKTCWWRAEVQSKPNLWSWKLKRRRRSNDPKPRICRTLFDYKKKPKEKIWREDPAQPEGDPLTKLAKFIT